MTKHFQLVLAYKAFSVGSLVIFYLFEEILLTPGQSTGKLCINLETSPHVLIGADEANILVMG